MATPHILVTNDDGIHALGLQVLEQALHETGRYRLTVVAPSDQQSASSHSLTLTTPVRVLELGEGRYAVTGQAAFEIFPESETKFFLKVVDGSVEFVKDSAGKVTGMVLNQGGRSMPAKRIEK